MDARELRIGNLVNYQTAEGDILVARIDWQDLKWISKDEKGFNIAHSAIPLTEEWLVKFGFEKRKDLTPKECIDEVFLFSKGAFFVFHHSIDNCCLIDYVKSDELGALTTKIKHVHQLQNLYFALTGEELTIKTK